MPVDAGRELQLVSSVMPERPDDDYDFDIIRWWYATSQAASPGNFNLTGIVPATGLDKRAVITLEWITIAAATSGAVLSINPTQPGVGAAASFADNRWGAIATAVSQLTAAFGTAAGITGVSSWFMNAAGRYGANTNFPGFVTRGGGQGWAIHGLAVNEQLTVAQGGRIYLPK